jgi:phosphonopyruvate decarboxylase
VISASAFVGAAVSRGYRFWSGVPCSFLTPFINYVIDSDELTYVGATSEGEAVGISFGAFLGGQRTVTICQNSGLGNMVNPLASLNYPFRIPTLLITTLRGAPGIPDEPQHELMGQVTPQLLDVLRIPWRAFPDHADEIDPVMDEASAYMTSEQRPFALIMQKDAVETHELCSTAAYRASRPPITGTFGLEAGALPRRLDAIRAVAGAAGDRDLLIATTGKTGRELYALGHASNHLYVVGGMGCASGIGLGLSLARPDRRVIVLDGDGAALMKMGTLASIGHYAPPNLVHVLLDNRAHESTGAQWTVSGSIDFAAIAAACGYHTVHRCESPDGLAALVTEATTDGPHFIHMRVAVGSDPKLPRPHLSPVQVKEQFLAALGV